MYLHIHKYNMNSTYVVGCTEQELPLCLVVLQAQRQLPLLWHVADLFHCTPEFDLQFYFPKFTHSQPLKLCFKQI